MSAFCPLCYHGMTYEHDCPRAKEIEDLLAFEYDHAQGTFTAVYDDEDGRSQRGAKFYPSEYTLSCDKSSGPIFCEFHFFPWHQRQCGTWLVPLDRRVGPIRGKVVAFVDTSKKPSDASSGKGA